ncbi:MAG: hypothetical protein OXG30_11990 [bacterium]|nr:hypothetical protein [bacterium]
MTAVSEIERTELVNQLVATIGEGPAETLMNCVLPDGRDQLATKEDFAKFATKEDLTKFATKEDFAKFATKEDLTKFATKEDFAKFATKEDLTKFATKDDLEIFGAKLRAELRAEFRAEMAKQTRLYLTIMTAFMVPIWAAMAAQFFG